MRSIKRSSFAIWAGRAQASIAPLPPPPPPPPPLSPLLLTPRSLLHAPCSSLLASCSLLLAPYCLLFSLHLAPRTSLLTPCSLQLAACCLPIAIHPSLTLHRPPSIAHHSSPTAHRFVPSSLTGFFYFTLNPGGRATGGVLLDDWRTPDQRKLRLILSYTR